MNLPWFRMYYEFMGDPVIQSLPFDMQRHYVIVLCLKCSGALDRAISRAAKDRIIQKALGVDDETFHETLQLLHETDLVTAEWQPVAWESRQYVSDNSTERVRKHRKQLKDKEPGNVTVTNNETLPSRSRNGPDTDTDTDLKNSLSYERDQKNSGKRKNEKLDLSKLPEDLSPNAWEDFLKYRKAIKAPITTQTAVDRIAAEICKAKEAGMPPDKALGETMAAGWRGVKCEWLLNREKAEQQAEQIPRSETDLLLYAKRKGLDPRPGETTEQFRRRVISKLEVPA